jgi:hypothetical protein
MSKLTHALEAAREQFSRCEKSMMLEELMPMQRHWTYDPRRNRWGTGERDQMAAVALAVYNASVKHRRLDLRTFPSPTSRGALAFAAFKLMVGFDKRSTVQNLRFVETLLSEVARACAP